MWRGRSLPVKARFQPRNFGSSIDRDQHFEIGVAKLDELFMVLINLDCDILAQENGGHSPPSPAA